MFFSTSLPFAALPKLEGAMERPFKLMFCIQLGRSICFAFK